MIRHILPDTNNADEVSQVFSRSAQHFDRSPVWSILAHALLECIELPPGVWVLDVGCGTGALALAAARAVGPQGTVLGIDIAENMLSHARRHAASLGLANLTFRCANMDRFEDVEKFDIVLGGFSLFFSDDMTALVRRLRRLTCDGGVWAFSFWADRFFPPLGKQLLADLAAFGVDLSHDIAAFYERYGNPDYLHTVFQSAGKHTELHQRTYRFSIANHRQWWTLVSHTGLRALVDRLPQDRKAAFREYHLARIQADFPDAKMTLELPVYFVVVRF